MTEPRVEYVDADPNGLAAMLGGLIEANLSQHPDRASLLKPAVIGINAPDAGVAVTFHISPGAVRVANGLPRSKADLVVTAASDVLVELSSVPLKFGLPDAMTPAGREVNRKLFNGQIKVKGLLRHPAKLARLNKLLSVV